MSELRIGISKGPGETPHEYTFVSPTPSSGSSTASLSTMTPLVDGRRAHILARVTQRLPCASTPIRFWPTRPSTPPRVAGVAGL